MVFTHEIIEGVRKHPVLYNSLHPDYRCKRIRDEEWIKLGEELKESRDELRKKWKNIRDCYKKYLRSISPGCPALIRSYKNWQWADSMDFCKPFILLTEAELNTLETEINNDTDDQISENTNASFSENIKEKKYVLEMLGTSEPTSLNRPNQIQQNREQVVNALKLDATDLIFLGYSNIIKSFTSTKQAIVKMKIAQIVMEEELYHAEGISFQSRLICKPSSSTDNIMANNSTTEINMCGEKNVATTNVEVTKPKRTRKRKPNRTSEENLCSSSYVINHIEEEPLEIKLEAKDILDSD